MIEKLKSIDNTKLADTLIQIYEEYNKPAFGSMSKRDLDILLFMKLQELGVIESSTDIYNLISILRISRGKARNLLYESKMRSSNDSILSIELLELLINPILEKDCEQVKIEIENPYMIDYLKSKMKKLKLLSDGSFSREIVTMSMNSFEILISSFVSIDRKEKLIKEFQRKGIIAESPISKYTGLVFQSIGRKLMGEIGSEMGKDFLMFLRKFVDENIEVSNIT